MSQLWQDSTSVEAETAKPRRLRLPYNALFLPEYLSTMLLSVLISWLFLMNVNAGAVRGRVTSHVAAATAVYVALAAMLLWITWRHRVIYSDVLFRREPDGRLRIRVAREWIDLNHLESIEESVGTFFGRAARVLHGRSTDNGLFEVNECLSGFDQLKTILGELQGIEVERVEPYNADRMQILRERWLRRHRVFPPAFNAIDAAGRLGFRLFCLLPVALVDVSINVVLNVLLQEAGRGTLTVYAAPLSLLASAFIARYVYYYMFTSTRLNQRIG